MTLRTATPLPPMDISEIDDIVFDFSRHMQCDETISSVTIEAEFERGVLGETDVQAMVVGTPGVGRLDGCKFVVDPAGQMVIQRISAVGRIALNVYCIRCTVSLATPMGNGRRLMAAAHIGVKRF